MSFDHADALLHTSIIKVLLRSIIRRSQRFGYRSLILWKYHPGNAKILGDQVWQNSCSFIILKTFSTFKAPIKCSIVEDDSCQKRWNVNRNRTNHLSSGNRRIRTGDLSTQQSNALPLSYFPICTSSFHKCQYSKVTKWTHRDTSKQLKNIRIIKPSFS